MTTIKDISTAKISAMKAKDSFRSQTIGSILAMVKQQEVDTRSAVDDTGLISILNRMVKQRQDSITQFTAGNRLDLVEIEQKELDIIKEFLPQQATEEEIEDVISHAISSTGATNLKDLGRIMPIVKAALNGKVDMSKISQLVKNRLS